ncbi:MAG: ATP-binding cassette domain-containing protein [Propionibacteriaceae bacterium]|nr:ATP-binding cassette domain-containing protein [Propionibacteriaceae bacterium]
MSHTQTSETGWGHGTASPDHIHAGAFTWTPLGASAPILNLSLDIAPGERVLLAGTSGAGKSTLLRALAGVLDEVSPGEAGGVLTVGGEPPMAGSGRVVLVGQNPQDSRVAATVGRDVAFGLENQGLAPGEIWARVDEALAAVGFPYGPEHSTQALSGGQLQRLALAGALAMRPGVLALDEPVSMLDPDSAAELRAAIASGLRGGLIVADHDLTAWLGLVDRLIVLGSGGTVIADGPIGEVLASRRDELLRLGLWVPGVDAPTPTAVSLPGASGHTVRAEGVSVTRRTNGLRVGTRQATLALDGVDSAVAPGEFLALRGASGSGKTTLIGAMCGLIRPEGGLVRWDEETGPEMWDSRTLASRLGWVPQFAEATAVGSTVVDSMIATASALGHDPGEARDRALTLLDAVGLADKADRHPLRLSGGEQRRLAVATALLHSPGVVALDEPTVGLDRHTWAAVTGLMLAARDAGAAVLASTHDQHLLAIADRTQTLSPPERSPDAQPERRRAARGLLSRCGPVALLVTMLVFVPAGMFSSGLVPLAFGVGAAVAAGMVLTGFRFPLIRFLPVAIGVATVVWSNWFFASPRVIENAVAAGLRMAFIALPGIVAASYLDATKLGDQLGQLLRWPPRPVLALVAGLQRVDDMHTRWTELSTARRARGLLPGRSPLARLRHGASLLFALLIDSVEHAGRLTVAMETRGYSAHLTGATPRTWACPAPWRRADTVLVVISLVLACVPAVVAVLL